MDRKTIMKGAFLAVCIIGMLVLPAAAAGQGSGVNQGLRNDLWANQQQYRLQEFDNHVQEANSVISILGKYNIDTTQMQATLASISGERAALQTALTSEDRAGLQAVNADLVPLWKQFMQETQESIRAQRTSAQSAATTGSDGTAGTVDST
ncbi:hypothetical protein [Methanoregula sp.]|uniref:hypothetical protein n=1 Tax=Methanoregula sp. TaxID=2052170 RepID=UPI003C773DC7